MLPWSTSNSGWQRPAWVCAFRPGLPEIQHVCLCHHFCLSNHNRPERKDWWNGKHSLSLFMINQMVIFRYAYCMFTFKINETCYISIFADTRQGFVDLKEPFVRICYCWKKSGLCLQSWKQSPINPSLYHILVSYYPTALSTLWEPHIVDSM